MQTITTRDLVMFAAIISVLAVCGWELASYLLAHVQFAWTT